MAAPMAHARFLLRALKLTHQSRWLLMQARPSTAMYNQFNRHFADESSVDDGKSLSERTGIELSRPKRKRSLAKNEDKESSSSSSNSSDSASDGTSSGESSGSDSDSDLDPEVVSAAHDVAIALGGDTKQTASELLDRLRSHSTLQQGTPAEAAPMNQVFKGMRVEQRSRRIRGHGRGGRAEPDPHLRGGRRHPASSVQVGEDGHEKLVEQVTAAARAATGRPVGTTTPPGTMHPRARQEKEMKLFGEGSLGIFPKMATVEQALPMKVGESLFELLQREELDRKTTFPADNAFEEQIRWTKQGKLWHFPIDNEQGMEEESTVSFHEHVFLEHLLVDFPRKGPIRHFMDLVCVGLSKNPYLTVQEKHAHIDWFRNYFTEKKHVIDEVVVDKEAQMPQKEVSAA